MCEEIIIDGKKFVRADKAAPAVKLDGMDFVIVRTYSAGVHFGYLKSRDGKEVTLVKSRRVWYWSGAASLSEMAVRGVKNPTECKFPAELEEIILTEAIEIIPCTEKARQSLQGVPEWKA